VQWSALCRGFLLSGPCFAALRGMYHLGLADASAALAVA
jgi:hypothetical protein